MNCNLKAPALLGIALLLLWGCAAAPEDAGFREVQRTAANRTGVLVQWNQNSADDKILEAHIRAMLSAQLTPNEAVQIALLNNRNLQAEFEDLGVAQADFVQAGLLKNPVFDVGIRIPTRGPSRTYLDFSVAEDFMHIFFIPARRRLAAAEFEKVTAQVTEAVLTLAADARSAFFNYQAAVQVVDLRRTIAEAADESAEAAQRLHDAGNTTDLDLANAKSQSARAQIDLTDAQADAAEAREKLNQLLGLWGQDTGWTVESRLPELPSTEISPAGLESVALNQRLDLAAARHEIDVQAQALGFTVETRFFSDVTIGPEAERETDGQWRIGPRLSLPIPLFDQGQAAIPRAEALFRQSQQRYRAMAMDVQSEVRAARIRMFSARSKAMFYHDQVLPLQEQVVQQTQLEYDGMLVGVFQLLLARRDQIETSTEYIESLRDYWTARTELIRALGGSIPPIEPTTLNATSFTNVKPQTRGTP